MYVSILMAALRRRPMRLSWLLMLLSRSSPQVCVRTVPFQPLSSAPGDHDEVERAKEAASRERATPTTGTTIFSQILSKEIPANIIYEDDEVCFCLYHLLLDSYK